MGNKIYIQKEKRWKKVLLWNIFRLSSTHDKRIRLFSDDNSKEP